MVGKKCRQHFLILYFGKFFLKFPVHKFPQADTVPVNCSVRPLLYSGNAATPSNSPNCSRIFVDPSSDCPVPSSRRSSKLRPLAQSHNLQVRTCHILSVSAHNFAFSSVPFCAQPMTSDMAICTSEQHPLQINSHFTPHSDPAH